VRALRQRLGRRPPEQLQLQLPQRQRPPEQLQLRARPRPVQGRRWRSFSVAWGRTWRLECEMGNPGGRYPTGTESAQRAIERADIHDAAEKISVALDRRIKFHAKSAIRSKTPPLRGSRRMPPVAVAACWANSYAVHPRRTHQGAHIAARWCGPKWRAIKALSETKHSFPATARKNARLGQARPRATRDARKTSTCALETAWHRSARRSSQPRSKRHSRAQSKSRNSIAMVSGLPAWIARATARCSADSTQPRRSRPLRPAARSASACAP